MTAAVAFDINYYSCHSKKQWNATIWDWLTIFLYYADFWAPQEKAVLCVCVCVIQASHTKTALCLFVKLLKQLQHQELRPFLTTGLWDVPSMANLWNQSCSVGKNFPVWLWKFSRASPPFYSYKLSPVWWGVLTPIWNTVTQTCVHKCIYRTRYLLHSRHLKFYIF